MHLRLALEPHDTLVVHLREGEMEAAMPARPARAGVRSLMRALQGALAGGYGECFWPGRPDGQYWWIFKRQAETLEVVAMWTRGGASSWEHVFRATDAAAWVHDQLSAEVERLGLRPSR